MLLVATAVIFGGNDAVKRGWEGGGRLEEEKQLFESTASGRRLLQLLPNQMQRSISGANFFQLQSKQFQETLKNGSLLGISAKQGSTLHKP